ncbi:MAG: rhomboid family intramembrane serine protease [Actinobacteria bacterium]|nr:rhomboid family intramembrane serine protease [Actinomycetota bacterium]
MVLPVGDVNPTRRRAVVTVLLVLANLLVYVLAQAPLAGCAEEAFILEWAAVPRELLSFRQLSDSQLGALLSPSCDVGVVDDKNVVVSAFSAMFLHGNLAHLGGNLLFLWVFGNNVEDRLGHLRYLLFYVVGGLAATYAFALLNPDSTVPLLGASGAIAAILGAYLVMYPRAWVHTYVPFPLYVLAWIIPGARITAWFLIFAIVTLPAWLVLGAWFGLQVLATRSPVTDNVAYAAHVAGFVAGIALVLLLDRRHERRGEPTYRPARTR